ncbi:MAG TPA: ATP-binding protein [Acidobacteriota bacterium]|nr:ATP-binding protein [Acidobacteriota bacterium]
MTATYSIDLNKHFVSGARLFSQAASVFVILVGLLVLTGWIFDIAMFKSVYGNITMKANAALCLILSGTSLLVLTTIKNAMIRHLAQGLAALVATIGILTLSQHIIGWDLGIDKLLFAEETGARATASPGRMGPPASSCYTLLGISLILFFSHRKTTLAQVCAAAVIAYSMLALTGYTYGAQELYGIARYTGIALHTVLSLFILGLGILASNIDRGITSVIARNDAGGAMARRLLLPAITVPFLLGFIRLLGQHHKLYDLGFGTALFTVAIIIFFTLAIWRTAAKVSQVERKRVETEVALRQSEGRFQAAIRHTPLIIANQDANLRYTWVHNPVVPIKTEQILGKRDDEFLPGEEASLLMKLKRNVLESGNPAHEQLKIHFDGKKYILDVTIEPILDEKGSIVGITSAAIDITVAKEIEAQLRRANELKDQFLATVSHELRTPLHSILGWANLMQRGNLDDATQKRAVEAIEFSAKVQAQLIEDLLDVSRIISGKMQLAVEPVELASVIQSAVESVQHAADAKSIKIRVISESDANNVVGDPTRLQQVVWNLLSNAVKFSSKESTVEVKLQRKDSQAQVTVSDTGEGISSDFLPYVFDRFRQADGTTTRRHGGLGLGLAIARHIVEMHGGTIEAFSGGEGHGATFCLKLPLTPIQKSNLNSGGTALSSKNRTLTGAVSTKFKGLRILVVDDEKNAREMLEVLLANTGAHVQSFSSTKEALRHIQDWKPDLVISDIGMPEEDGYALIRQIRLLQPDSVRSTPAIALTGYARIEERMKALEEGYQMFVPKPVEADELLSIIDNLLKKSAQNLK